MSRDKTLILIKIVEEAEIANNLHGHNNAHSPFCRQDTCMLHPPVKYSKLEHIESIDRVLRGIARLLRPGGHLIFTSPTEAFSDYLALHSKYYVARRNRHFIHLNLWPFEEWVRRLEQVGLQIENSGLSSAPTGYVCGIGSNCRRGFI